MYGFKSVEKEQFYNFIKKYSNIFNIKHICNGDTYSVIYKYKNDYIIATTITPLMGETIYYISTEVLRFIWIAYLNYMK